MLIEGYKCERCGHEWAPRKKDEAPKVSPKCRSPYRDRPKKRATGRVEVTIVS